MTRIVKTNSHRWEAVKAEGESSPRYVITLETPAGGYFADYVVEFHQEVHNQAGEVYPRVVNYPAEDWTAIKIAIAIEEGDAPTSEYIPKDAPAFYNNRSSQYSYFGGVL